jgi:hypothetical protein
MTGNRNRGLARLGIALQLALVAALSAGEPGPRARLEHYQQALRAAQAQDVDTTAAERLAARSRQAAKQGKMEDAQGLLEAAIEALPKATADSRPAAPLPTPAPAAGPAQPVFFLAFTHHYNGPGGYYPTAAEVREIGEFFHRQHVPGTLFFDGILVERLQQEDPSVLAQVRDWGLPIGYHGEETHGPYPVASELLGEIRTLREAQGYRGPWSLTTGRPWAEAVRLVTERYSFARPYRIDPTTRRIDRQQAAETDRTHVGGLRLVQQALGKDVSMMTSHALESAPEGYAFRRLSGFAYDQPAVPIAAHALRIFRAEALAPRVMAVAGENESIFWFMGRLMSKGDDDGEAGSTAVGLRRTTADLDRSRPRLLLVGFSHLDEPRASNAVRFVSSEFLPANPGSAWVSGETIMAHFQGEKELALRAADLDAVAAALLAGWSNRPPDLVPLPDGRVLSLCDAFEALVQAVLPTAAARPLAIQALYGPLLEDDRALLKAESHLERRALAAAATELLAAWEKQPASERFVPTRITVGRHALNPAEFLYALATARRNADATAITARPSQAFPPYAEALQELFTPKAIQPLCYTKGQLWTVKPARLRRPPVAQAPAPTVPTPPAPTVPTPAAPTPAAAGGEVLRLAFAANLDSLEPCHRDGRAGADLYTVRFDTATGSATELQRLTRTAGLAEWFPALSPDGRRLVYDAEEPTPIGRPRHVLRLLELKTSRDTLMETDARCPAFAADGRTLFFSRQARHERGLCLAALTDGAAPTLGATRLFADRTVGPELVEDPAPLPDGSGVVFHRKMDARTGAGLAFIRIDGSGLQQLTPFDGCGHAAVAPDGTAVACTRSRDGAVIIVPKTATGWGAPQQLPLSTAPADWNAYDARFGQVRQVRHCYVAWVTPELLLLTTHGAEGDHDFRFARVVLLRLHGCERPPRILDVSTAIERLAGKSGRDFCSADGVVLH